MKYRYAPPLTALSFLSASALAVEYPVGHPILKMVWKFKGLFQPITMDTEEGHHAMNHLAADKADIHLKQIFMPQKIIRMGLLKAIGSPTTIEYTAKSDATSEKKNSKDIYR